MVGAGATGCEYAEFFLSCGSRVTLLSARPQILPAEDPDVAEIVQEAFLARGMRAAVRRARHPTWSHRRGRRLARPPPTAAAFDGSHAIICMGQRPNTAGLGLEVLGVELDERGAIVVDGNLCSTAEHVYAAGDVAGGMMLASTAADAGPPRGAARARAHDHPLRLQNVPWTIFTRPECASVGAHREQTAAGARRDVAVTKHYLGATRAASSRASDEGMIKLVADADRRRAARRLDRRLPGVGEIARSRWRCRPGCRRDARRQRHRDALDVGVAAARRREGRDGPHEPRHGVAS